MHTTRASGHVNAPRPAVHRAPVSAEAVARRLVPPGTRSEVHAFEACEDCGFRISLTHDSPDAVGGSSAHTDTHHGRFARLVPGEPVVEVLEFETWDSGPRGTTTITTALAEAGNEAGTRSAPARLARFTEADT